MGGKDDALQDDARPGEARRGSIEVGTTVAFAYVDQSRDGLDPEATVFDEISEGQSTWWWAP